MKIVGINGSPRGDQFRAGDSSRQFWKGHLKPM